MSPVALRLWVSVTAPSVLFAMLCGSGSFLRIFKESFSLDISSPSERRRVAFLAPMGLTYHLKLQAEINKLKRLNMLSCY